MNKKNISKTVGLRGIRRNRISSNASLLQLCTSFRRKFLRPYMRYWWRNKYYY